MAFQFRLHTIEIIYSSQPTPKNFYLEIGFECPQLCQNVA